MKISISNIAWDKEEDEAVASLLNKYDVDAIDIAPGKYFPDVLQSTDEQIKSVKEWWAQRGIAIIGMQSLLFGTQGLNLFDDEPVRQEMLTHLTAICRIASGVGAAKLVFGSPKNRDKKALSDDDVRIIAVGFFRELANIAQKFNVIICLEPNPVHYGANFMTTAAETASIVKAVNHDNIRMQLDTGAVILNQEDISELLKNYPTLIGHIHLSEPRLAPPGGQKENHHLFSHAIKTQFPEMYATIEMLTEKEDRLESIEQALIYISEQYRETP
ncbi:sugar phosphate isomerase/epimerase family protein [Kalamiella sp. sgz302252]|uniref:sugar phosphate isomerase/epimerase family protein n=1 Tax=Pantoea sp. sgz302252 TaxID=3341827 RepID=UPI0036D35AE4